MESPCECGIESPGFMSHGVNKIHDLVRGNINYNKINFYLIRLMTNPEVRIRQRPARTFTEDARIGVKGLNV